MSLIVEDGTVVTSAEVYSTLAEFRAYRPRGGLALPVGLSDALTEAALVRGTAFVDATFPLHAMRSPGVKLTQIQSRLFPRYEAYDESGYYIEGVPESVKNSCMEAGIIESITPGALSEALERGGMLIRKKTGPLEREYAPNAPAYTVYPIIRQCYADIVRIGGNVRLSR